MSNQTGFYRVSRADYKYKTKNGTKTKIKWVYQVNNNLITKQIKSDNLIKLKMKVLEEGFMWGIVDLEKAEKTALLGRCNIKDLQGKYGIQI